MVKKNYEVFRYKDRAFGGFMLHPTCVIFLADVPTSRCVKLLVVFCLKPSKLFVSILEMLAMRKHNEPYGFGYRKLVPMIHSMV